MKMRSRTCIIISAASLLNLQACTEIATDRHRRYCTGVGLDKGKVYSFLEDRQSSESALLRTSSAKTVRTSSPAIPDSEIPSRY